MNQSEWKEKNVAVHVPAQMAELTAQIPIKETDWLKQKQRVRSN